MTRSFIESKVYLLDTERHASVVCHAHVRVYATYAEVTLAREQHRVYSKQYIRPRSRNTLPRRGGGLDSTFIIVRHTRLMKARERERERERKREKDVENSIFNHGPCTWPSLHDLGVLPIDLPWSTLIRWGKCALQFLKEGIDICATSALLVFLLLLLFFFFGTRDTEITFHAVSTKNTWSTLVSAARDLLSLLTDSGVKRQVGFRKGEKTAAWCVRLVHAVAVQ